MGANVAEEEAGLGQSARQGRVPRVTGRSAGPPLELGPRGFEEES